ncbi:MAG: Holliday junction branch migration protein RuvA [bacterium]
MIGRIRGRLIHKSPPFLMVEAAGLGYELEAPLSTFGHLPELGDEVILLTHLMIKDDSHTLFAFAEESERILFRSLLKISGIGAKLALVILSGFTPQQFGTAICEENAALLVKLPGIGKKTAERIVIEMRDKVEKLGLLTSTVQSQPGQDSTSHAQEASEALLALGYKAGEVSRMLAQLEMQGMSTEDILRQALQGNLK